MSGGTAEVSWTKYFHHHLDCMNCNVPEMMMVVDVVVVVDVAVVAVVAVVLAAVGVVVEDEEVLLSLESDVS